MKINTFFTLLLMSVWLSCQTAREVETGKSAALQSTKEKIRQNKQLVHFMDADLLRLKGDFKNAANAFELVLKEYPENHAAHFALSRIYFAKSQLALAEQHSRQAIKLDKNNKYYLEYLIQILMYQKKFADAESLYADLLAMQPNNNDLLYKQAMLAFKSKSYDKALKRFEEIERKTGFNEEVILQKKSILLNLNRVDDAVAEIKKLQTAYPNVVEWELQIADIYLDAGRNKDYEKVYEEIALKYAREPMAQIALAQFFDERRDTAAYRKYMKAIMQNPNMDAGTKLGLLRASLKNISDEDDAAETSFFLDLAGEIQQQEPDNNAALGLYADLLNVFGRNRDAIGAYQKIIVRDQSRFAPWQQLMLLYSQESKYDSVIYYSQDSRKYFPEELMSYYFEGSAYLALKQPQKALEPLYAMQQKQRVNPEVRSQLLSALGDAHHQLEQYSKSDSCFDAALKLFPNDAGTLNNYAYYLSLRKDKLELAAQMSKRSLELQPGSQSFLDTYGWILFQQGKYPEALKYIQQAVNAGEADAVLLEHLGDVYFKLNQVDEALKYWKMSAEKAAPNPTLQRKMNEKNWYE